MTGELNYTETPWLYPSENVAARELCNELYAKHKDKNMGDRAVREAFEREVAGRFADSIGLLAAVTWDVGDYENDDQLYPTVIIDGRLDAKTNGHRDHDRIKHEVREGWADGIVGVIDPNTGQRKDDAKRKDIY